MAVQTWYLSWCFLILESAYFLYLPWPSNSFYFTYPKLKIDFWDQQVYKKAHLNHSKNLTSEQHDCYTRHVTSLRSSKVRWVAASVCQVGFGRLDLIMSFTHSLFSPEDNRSCWSKRWVKVTPVLSKPTPFIQQRYSHGVTANLSWIVNLRSLNVGC